MATTHLTQLLIEYRYWILVPLSFFESAIVAFVAGTLASLGYFNLYVLAAFFFVRDIVLDLGYYALGHYGSKTRLAQKMLKKLHITEDHFESVRQLWEAHPARTMFIGKLSYGIASTFIVVAGTVRMSLRKFVLYGALVAVVQYGVLLALGYFFGAAFGGSITTIIQNIQYVLAGASLLLIGYFFFALRMRKRMLKDDAVTERGDSTPSV
jgi:membrane protein DedA with SNARE-associated domain